MDEVVKGLFISSWEIAKDENLLQHNNIQKIVNIGCKDDITYDFIDYSSFPNVLDNPETIIFVNFKSTNRIISVALSCGQNVLVHCVYGQSRSAAVILSYMMYTGLKLEFALSELKKMHPSICINPGFLCQLYFIQQANELSSEYRLAEGFLCSSTQTKQTDSSSGADENIDEKIVMCKSCNSPLCLNEDRLTSKSVDCSVILDQHLDIFWKGYRPIQTSSSGRNNTVCKLPLSQNQMAVCGQGWIDEQIRTAVASGVDCGVLRCYKCEAECGEWRKKALDLLGIYNLCDLFVLHKNAVKIRRPRVS